LNNLSQKFSLQSILSFFMGVSAASRDLCRNERLKKEPLVTSRPDSVRGKSFKWKTQHQTPPTPNLSRLNWKVEESDMVTKSLN
jgi:hypothetical protein